MCVRSAVFPVCSRAGFAGLLPVHAEGLRLGVFDDGLDDPFDEPLAHLVHLAVCGDAAHGEARDAVGVPLLVLEHLGAAAGLRGQRRAEHPEPQVQVDGSGHFKRRAAFRAAGDAQPVLPLGGQPAAPDRHC